MRLLDTEKLVLHYFDDIPDDGYAILSHTWEKRDENGENVEVQFQDFQDPEKAKKKSGYEKIQQSAKQAEQDGFRFIWIDTCCIDTSSSTELTEAINSMFAW
jgi:Heterokaryon incompatibility protein (HET)